MTNPRPGHAPGSFSGPSVQFRTEALLAVGPEAIGALKAKALTDPKGRARLFLHAGHAAPVQEMVIAIRGGQAFSAHRQPAVERKTYVMLEGALEVVFFEGDGRRAERFRLEATGRERLLSFPAARWHACKAASEFTVYLEVIAGPYDPKGTQWQDWMP